MARAHSVENSGHFGPISICPPFLCSRIPPVCSSRGCLPVQKQKVKYGTHSVPASRATAQARDLTPALDGDARKQGLCRCHSDGGGGSSYNLFPEATLVAVLEAASGVGRAGGTSCRIKHKLGISNHGVFLGPVLRYDFGHCSWPLCLRPWFSDPTGDSVSYPRFLEEIPFKLK